MTSRADCIICSASDLHEIDAFFALPRVTSDCKPFPTGGRLFVCEKCGGIQKLPDANWTKDIQKIYAGYEIYKLSDGEEQLIFTDSGPVPRSKRLINFLKSATDLPLKGRIIDIGCGNGSALATFSRAFPGWKLYGSELSDRALPGLQTLRNFVDIYTTQIDEIPGQFELVSMIHSLEHMPSPRRSLESAARLLAEGGNLFIEVPDVETSPFDLLVADHLIHFSRDTLKYLTAEVGLAATYLSNSVLPKEITLLANSAPAKSVTPVGQNGVQLAHDSVRWLNQLLTLARELARSDRFGIFGTSISGMWLFGALSDEVSFFVDEDPKRIGRECAGKPVFSPLDAPSGAIVFIPMAPATAVKISERYATAPARFVPSPALIDVSAGQQ